jgi:hypothetical protein
LVAGAFVGALAAAFAGTFVVVFTGAFAGAFVGAFAAAVFAGAGFVGAALAGTFVGALAAAFAGVFAATFTGALAAATGFFVVTAFTALLGFAATAIVHLMGKGGKSNPMLELVLLMLELVLLNGSTRNRAETVDLERFALDFSSSEYGFCSGWVSISRKWPRAGLWPKFRL